MSGFIRQGSVSGFIRRGKCVRFYKAGKCVRFYKAGKCIRFFIYLQMEGPVSKPCEPEVKTTSN